MLARWNDAASSPALVEKQVGRSRVLLWTMTADKAWSDWPTEPSFVLTIRETAKAVARTDAGVHSLTAGEVLSDPITTDRQISSPTVELPGGEEPRPLTLDSESNADAGGQTVDDPAQVLVWKDTGRAGLYRLNWLETPGGAASDAYAVNPDARESDLARLPPDELRKSWRGVNLELITTTASADGSADVRGQELWRAMTHWLLALLGIEACFATWVGRQR